VGAQQRRHAPELGPVQRRLLAPGEGCGHRAP
jgi:hypothetical protein